MVQIGPIWLTPIHERSNWKTIHKLVLFLVFYTIGLIYKRLNGSLQTCPGTILAGLFKSTNDQIIWQGGEGGGEGEISN